MRDVPSKHDHHGFQGFVPKTNLTPIGESESSDNIQDKIIYGSCEYCGKPIYKAGRKFCSKLCRDRSKMFMPHLPTKARLEKLLLENNICEIGRMYGTTHTTVRKWCIKRGIDIKEMSRQRKEHKLMLKKLSATGRRPHYLYLDAPVTVDGRHRLRKFDNIYQAAEYARKNRWTKSPEEVIVKCIARAILGERKKYLSCVWISPEYVKQYENHVKERSERSNGKES